MTFADVGTVDGGHGSALLVPQTGLEPVTDGL